MANRNQYKASDFISKIPGSGGIINIIAQRVGCDWHTAKKYIDEYQTVNDAYKDECESVNDLAVSIILKSIQGGNTQDAKWWISRKRRDQFGDNVDVKQNIEGDIRIVFEYVGDSDDDSE